MKLYHVNEERAYLIPHANVNLGYVKMCDMLQDGSSLVVAFTEEAAQDIYQAYKSGAKGKTQIDWYGIKINVVE